MLRLLTGIGVGVGTTVGLNTLLLLFTPLGGMPLQGPTLLWHKIFGMAALIFWGVGVFGGAVLACRVAGRLEGLVSVVSAVLGTTVLVGLLPVLSSSVAAAYLQLGSIILSLPLLFIFYAGGLAALFARRPDMV